MNPRAIAKLIRLPNVVTAAADPLAGWLLCHGSFRAPGRWIPLVAAGMALYAGGMALNDAFDAERDRAERRDRPVPSGAISRRSAFLLGLGLLALGISSAAFSRVPASALLSVVLATTILFYDAVAKALWFGPLAMGACRGLNLLLGATHSTDLGGPAIWLACGAFAVFVAGLTWLARSEVKIESARNIAFSLGAQAFALLCLMAVAVRPSAFSGSAGHDRPLIALEGLLILGVVGLFVIRAGGKAWADPKPELVRSAVRSGILAVVWIDAALVAGAVGPLHATCFIALWAVAWMLRRTFAMT